MTNREIWAWIAATMLLGCSVSAELSFLKACRLLRESLQRETAAKLQLDVLRRSLLTPAREDFLPPELKRELET